MDEETKKFSEHIVSTTTKKKKYTEFDSWKAAVHRGFPRVFFPPLSAKKIKILNSICELIRNDGVEPEKLMEWLVLNWANMSNLMASKRYSIPYPELDLFLFEYAKILNIYKSRVEVQPPARKKSTRINIDDE